jgi:hypothetical protein
MAMENYYYFQNSGFCVKPTSEELVFLSYLTVLLHKIIVGLEGNLEGEGHLHFLNFRTISLQ